jgi:hypothetical protein
MPEDLVREELKDLACMSSESYSAVRAAVKKKLQNPALNSAICVGSAGTCVP